MNGIILQPITPNQIGLRYFAAKKSSVTTKASQGNIWVQINLEKKKSFIEVSRRKNKKRAPLKQRFLTQVRLLKKTT